MAEPPGKSPWAHWPQAQDKASIDAAALKTAKALNEVANQKGQEQEQIQKQSNQQLAASSFSRPPELQENRKEARLDQLAQKYASELKDRSQGQAREQQRTNDREMDR